MFLPDNEDPDSFVNKHKKDYFINFSKESSIPIHSFIFNHYKGQTDNDPSSMATFEKKLRSIASTIKDEFIKKYILEYFLEQVSNLTPYQNNFNKKYFSKNLNSLDSTKKYFNETKSLSLIEIKEFSFLYLILKNLDLFKRNSHVIENVKLFTKENSMIFDELLIKIKSSENFNLNDLSIDRQLIDRIFRFASIKHIVDTENHEKILSLLDEIIRDLKNYELELRIEELESKFSKDLSESTFNEIRELKKLQKIN